jgi:hypothetical protein
MEALGAMEGFDRMNLIELHPTEDTLEQYLIHGLPDSEVELLEEHLLICQTCVDTAEKFDAFLQSIRSTLELAIPKTRAASRDNAVDG